MKIAPTLIDVIIVDVLLLFLASFDVNQVGVARAFRAHADNPTVENLRARDQVFAAASLQQAYNRAFAFLGILVVTSAGAFTIGRRFERQPHQPAV